MVILWSYCILRGGVNQYYSAQFIKVNNVFLRITLLLKSGWQCIQRIHAYKPEARRPASIANKKAEAN